MLLVKELTDDNVSYVCARFNYKAGLGERIMALYLDGESPYAIAAAEYFNGAVNIKYVSDVSDTYRDLLLRSLLNLLSSLNEIEIVSYIHTEYFKQFGFRQCGDCVKIKNKDIKFNCNCK